MEACLQLATDILGTKVKTTEGEQFGVVQDIMVDPPKGTIVYIVLCYADFNGKNHRHYAIPHQMVTLTSGDEKTVTLELDINVHELRDAPEFSPNSWSVNPFNEDPKRIFELLPEGSATDFLYRDVG